MHIRLPLAQEEFVQRKVAHGAFPSPDALISEAISLLQQQDCWTKDAAARIEQGWNDAKAGLLISEEALIQHLSERKAAWKADRHEQ
jgi:Arc/MetJ-type ribon-helix-helix transcriptional regulator